MFSVKELFDGECYALAMKAHREGKSLSVFDAHVFERTFFSAALSGKTLYVCADPVVARERYEQLKGIEAATVLLPPSGDLLVYKKMASAMFELDRLSGLNEIAAHRAKIVVTSVPVLSESFPKAERLRRDVFTLIAGNEYSLDELKRKLVGLGYRHSSLTECAGEFSSRGDILDIWGVNSAFPVRAEFFGDELESLRKVNPTTFLSEGNFPQLEVIPATDVFCTECQSEKIKKKLSEAATTERGLSVAADIKFKLETGVSDVSLGYIKPLLDGVGINEFFRPETVVYDDAKAVYDSATVFCKEQADRFEQLLALGEAMPFHKPQKSNAGEYFEFDCKAIAFHRLTSDNRIFRPDEVVTFDGKELPDYSRDYVRFAAELEGMSKNRIIDIMCGNPETVEIIGNFLTRNELAFSVTGDGKINLHPEHIDRGGIFVSSDRVVIGSYDISTRRMRSVTRRRKNAVFTVPEVGDYVVHEKHGIGYCLGVGKISQNGAERDYLAIEYADGDKLYVPVENIDSLSKFVADGVAPKLNKIGGTDFEKVKEKVRASVKKLAFDLVKLYADRKKAKGFVCSDDDSYLEEFCADFPYSETEDQLTAVSEGLADLKSGKVMDRLLCGDVGYGKTEVALRLAFKVITCGKQAAFISPTTILACQHFDTAVKRMERYGVRVARLTRFDTPNQVIETLEKLSKGEVDFVCGTHRILQKDVVFKDLGLLILDEEQRFGVADKEKLKLIKTSVNVLSLSATPIPRTLYMTMVNVRDISVLDTPPRDRLPVRTFVSEYSDGLVVDAVNREVARGGQVFIVYNRVSSIAEYAESIASLVPSAKIAVAHGQMPEVTLEKTITSFVEGRYDVLVASTIIENGIDMPRANTIIVTESDRLGLAQMYQLRGRVGRSNRTAYAYFTYDGEKNITEDAFRRLEAITRHTELGSGFKIAMADLEIRGAGNILGREQHGHLERVGYDLYCKLLEDAVGELTGRPATSLRSNVRLVFDFPAFLSEDYVPDRDKRMSLYSRIALIFETEDKIALINELDDIYGPLPKEAENLISAALVKNLAGEAGAEKVTVNKGKTRLVYDSAQNIPEIVAAQISLCGNGYLSFDGEPAVNFGSFRELENFLLNCHEKIGVND